MTTLRLIKSIGRSPSRRGVLLIALDIWAQLTSALYKVLQVRLVLLVLQAQLVLQGPLVLLGILVRKAKSAQLAR